LDHLQPASRPSTYSAPPPRTELATSTAPTAHARALPAAQVHVSPAAVRAWAQANGFAVGDRGRLPSEVTDAYRRARQLTREH